MQFNLNNLQGSLDETWPTILHILLGSQTNYVQHDLDNCTALYMGPGVEDTDVIMFNVLCCNLHGGFFNS